MRKFTILLFASLLALAAFLQPMNSPDGIVVASMAGDRLADVLREAARIRRSGLPAEAIAAYSGLLLEAGAAGEEKLEADCLVALGELYWDGGDIDRSADCYARALRLAERNAWGGTRAACRTALAIRDLYQAGKKHRDGARYAQSAGCFRAAVELARKIGSPGHEAKCLRQMGITYYLEMKHEDFFAVNRKAYQLSRRHNLFRERANCVFNLAFYHLKTRAFYEAFVEFNEARGIYRLLGAHDDEAECLHNIALIYHDMGNYDQALRDLRALLRRASTDELKTAVLISMGNARRRSAFPEKDRAGLGEAADCYRRALDLAIRNKDAFQETVALNNLGYHYYQLKDFHLALKYFTLSHAAGKDLPDLGLKCAVLANVGNACLGLGKSGQAERHFTSAANRLSREKHPGILWEVFYGLGKCSLLEGRSGPALDFFNESMRLIDEAARNIAFDDDRSNHLSDMYDVYETVMKLLIDGRRFETLDPGTVVKLISVIEACRGQGIGEHLRRGNRPGKRGPASGGAATVEDVRDVLEGTGLDRLKSRLKSGDAALLMYFLGESLSFCIFLNGSHAVCRGLAPSDKLGAEADKYIKLLSSAPEGGFQGKRAAEILGGEVFPRDLERYLDGVRSLVVIPDGRLCSLPFESLVIKDRTSGKLRYLIEKHEVSYAPTLVTWILVNERSGAGRAPGRMLLVGKKNYAEYLEPSANEYLASMRRAQGLSGMSFPALPSVPREARDIALRMGREKATIWLDEYAGEDAVKSADLLSFRIIHFACHGLADESSPGRSALALTRRKGSREDGYLQVNEIRFLKLDAGLVVLSACRTGWGKFSRGEGVMGLTKAFFHAGAKSVLSSLWNVSDRSTTWFMSAFYTQLSRGATKGEALRLAKLGMIRSRYSHPYFWAPFVLSGDFASSCDLN